LISKYFHIILFPNILVKDEEGKRKNEIKYILLFIYLLDFDEYNKKVIFYFIGYI